MIFKNIQVVSGSKILPVSPGTSRPTSSLTATCVHLQTWLKHERGRGLRRFRFRLNFCWAASAVVRIRNIFAPSILYPVSGFKYAKIWKFAVFCSGNTYLKCFYLLKNSWIPWPGSRSGSIFSEHQNEIDSKHCLRRNWNR